MVAQVARLHPDNVDNLFAKPENISAIIFYSWNYLLH